MRGVQALKRVLDDRRDFGEREVLLATEPLVEPLPDEPLEGDPEPAVLLLAGAEDRGDVGRLDLFAMSASRLKRATRSGSCAARSWRTLSATFSPPRPSAA